jgi:hypothetical protein
MRDKRHAWRGAFFPPEAGVHYGVIIPQWADSAAREYEWMETRLSSRVLDFRIKGWKAPAHS